MKINKNNLKRQKRSLKAKKKLLFRVFSLFHVLSTKIKGEGFVTYIAANNQGGVKNGLASHLRRSHVAIL